MTDDMFDRLRQRRRDALAESAKQREQRFNPFRSGSITAVVTVPEADQSRVTLTLGFENGTTEVLRFFYAAHAAHLVRLSPQDRIEYLRSVWLNYSRALILLGRPAE